MLRPERGRGGVSRGEREEEEDGGGGAEGEREYKSHEKLADTEGEVDYSQDLIKQCPHRCCRRPEKYVL
jgi:hypothetical protein